MQRRKLSIAALVIAGLVAVATLLLCTLGYVGFNFLLERGREEFSRKNAVLADQLSTSLTLPLWNFDREQIDKIIEGAMRDIDVYAVVVHSAGDVAAHYGSVRDRDWKPIATGTDPVAAGLAQEKRAVVVNGNILGQVQVFITPKFLDARMRRTLGSIVAVIAGLDLVLMAGLYVLLRHAVLLPLREVERYALAVSVGDRGSAVPWGQRYLGELDSLRGSLEKMVRMLEARYAELSRSETRYRELAETLRESEEKFSTAFRSGPDAMSIAELETGRYLEINEGFERLFGFPRAEVAGRTSRELGIWRDDASRARFVEQLNRHGAVRDLEVENVTKAGQPITYILSAERLLLGGRLCIVSVIHDITDRKRAELERARAVDRERQTRDEFTRRLIASQEAERRRIAGELHDSLGQNLLLIKNRAQLALASATMPPEQRWQMESVQDMATQAITEVRQISHDLRPYQLDHLGLTRALESLIDNTARSTGFNFSRKFDAVDDAFAPEAATHLYRVVQESLNNILRHSRAQHADITLERDVHEVCLRITDDGRGFAPGEPAPGRTEGGFGLRNIAERVRILGGSLQIDSAPGRGTRLTVTIPLPEGI